MLIYHYICQICRYAFKREYEALDFSNDGTGRLFKPNWKLMTQEPGMGNPACERCGDVVDQVSSSEYENNLKQGSNDKLSLFLQCQKCGYVFQQDYFNHLGISLDNFGQKIGTLPDCPQCFSLRTQTITHHTFFQIKSKGMWPVKKSAILKLRISSVMENPFIAKKAHIQELHNRIERGTRSAYDTLNDVPDYLK